MPAYAIFIRDRLTDAEQYAAYAKMARAAKGDYQPLAAYGATETWEGLPAEGVVLLKFDSMDAAREWYFGDAYQQAKAVRERAGDYRVILFEGL